METCIYKSATLSAGEQFVLPPGAILIGASDEGSITSTCTIPDLEAVACYVALIGTNPDDGNVINYYEGADDGPGGAAKGFKLNNVDSDFNAPYYVHASSGYPTGLLDNFGDMANELMAKVPGIVAVHTATVTDSTRGCINYLIIKTIPSIATNLQIRLHGFLSGQAYQPNEVTSYTSFRLLDDVIGEGYPTTGGTTLTCP